MNIAIATCVDKPTLTDGDRLFVSKLGSLGASVSTVIWTDADSLNNALDAVIVRSTWDYHRQPDKFKSWITKASQVAKHLFNSAQVIEWNMDKSYLLELSKNGAICVPSLLFKKNSPIAEILAQIKTQKWQEVVIKPTISATAFLTVRSSLADNMLIQKLEQVQKHADVLVQPYYSSIESDGEVSVIFFNGKKIEYSHSILKKPKSGDFRVQSDFGGLESITVAPESLVTFAEAALKKVSGDWTFARVDIIDWKNQPLIGEIELIEPDLFLQMHPPAVEKLAQAILHKMNQ